MVDFRGKPLDAVDRLQEVDDRLADLRRKQIESLLDLMEHKLAQGMPVPDVLAMARRMVKIMHDLETVRLPR